MRKSKNHYSVHNEPIKTDEQFLADLFRAVDAYNLYAGKKLLFIYRTSLPGNIYSWYEVLFGKENFMHLTGIRALNFGAQRFYEKCLSRAIKSKEFTFTTSRKVASSKLDALPKLLLFEHATIYKMGDADLITLYNKFDTGLGNQDGMIGFDHRNASEESAVPVTAIKAPITDYVSKPYKVIAILMKDYDANQYDTVISSPKRGIAITELPVSLQKAISPEALQKICAEKI